MSEKGNVVLAAGGTGGHVFPALALAKKLLDEGYDVTLACDVRAKRYCQATEGLHIRVVQSASPSGSLIKKLWAGIKLTIGAVQALLLLSKLKPKAVVGFGGYPSFPTVVAAIAMKVRVIIHEQNAVLGKVNRVLLKYVQQLAVSYQNTQHVAETYRDKVVKVGMPVRQAIRDFSDTAYTAPKEGDPIKILVIGGSQGASVFAKLLPEAIGLLPEGIRARLHITHQVRSEDIEQVKGAYDGLPVKYEVAPFFENVAELMAQSHVVVTRAGASSVAEIVAMARPAIFIPFRYATDNHQMENAKELAQAKAAIVHDEQEVSAETLAIDMQTVFESPEKLEVMHQALRSLQTDKPLEDLVGLIEA